MSRLIACSFVIGMTVAAGGCATTGGTPRPFPSPVPPSPAPPTIPSATASAAPSAALGGATINPAALGYSITGLALNLRGTPYRNGGSDPSGFDCSGFVQYVFGQSGVAVPRTVSDQFRAGRDVDLQRLEPGDLVFFTTVAPGASHVGIAIGGDEFIHAPSGTGEVRVERLSTSYWAARFVGAKRILRS